MTIPGLLSATIFLPAVAGLVVLLLTRSNRQAYIVAVVGAVLTFLLSLAVFILYDADIGGVQLVEHLALGDMPFIQPQYLVGVDGLSAPMILLTGLLGLATIIYSFRIDTKPKQYFFWILLLQTAVMGVFASLDLLLFFVFFEFEVVPMFMLISMWGSGRRVYSATKFVLFTLAGGAFMLVAIILLFFSTGIESLAMVSIPELGIVGIPDSIGGAALIAPASLIFAFFLVAFAVKLPVWPIHTWLPDAHTNAPTGVSVMLAGVLLKMGGYGIYRICLGFFRETNGGFSAHQAAEALAWFAAISAIYGAILTVRQRDMKRMVAMSSVSHMGFVLLGAAAISSLPETTSVAGLNGGALQMFSHGVITGLMFLTVGMIYDRVHTRDMPALGGLIGRIPIIGIFVMIAGLASLGLPLLAGFSAEILVFLGSFQVLPVQTGIAAFSVVIAAVYVLWSVQRVLLGREPSEESSPAAKYYPLIKRIRPYELIASLVLAIPVVLIGVLPSLIVDKLNRGILDLLGL